MELCAGETYVYVKRMYVYTGRSPVCGQTPSTTSVERVPTRHRTGPGAPGSPCTTPRGPH